MRNWGRKIYVANHAKELGIFKKKKLKFLFGNFSTSLRQHKKNLQMKFAAGLQHLSSFFESFFCFLTLIQTSGSLVWSGLVDQHIVDWLTDRQFFIFDTEAAMLSSELVSSCQEMFVKRYLDIDVNSAAKGSPTFKEKCSKVDPKLR